MATRTKEPTTRAGILAAGLVRIVATPEQLTETQSWWVNVTGRRDGFSPGKRYWTAEDVRLARAARSTALPHWLKPPVTPREQVRRMFKESDAAYAKAAEYVGGKRYRTPREMTDAQRKAALGAIARRLRGEDGAIDFSMESY